MLHSSGSLFAHHTFLAGIKEQHGVAGWREREGRLGWWWWCKNCSRSRGACLPSHAEATYKKDQGEVEKEKPRNAVVGELVRVGVGVVAFLQAQWSVDASPSS